MFKYLFNPYKRAVDAIDRSRAEMREYALRKGIITEDDDLFKEVPEREPVRLDEETRRSMVAAIDESRARMREYAIQKGWIEPGEELNPPKPNKKRANAKAKGRDDSQNKAKKGWLAYL